MAVANETADEWSVAWAAYRERRRHSSSWMGALDWAEGSARKWRATHGADVEIALSNPGWRTSHTVRVDRRALEAEPSSPIFRYFSGDVVSTVYNENRHRCGESPVACEHETVATVDVFTFMALMNCPQINDAMRFAGYRHGDTEEAMLAQALRVGRVEIEKDLALGRAIEEFRRRMPDPALLFR